MNNIVPFQTIEYSKQRILTTEQVADAYETDVNYIYKNFQNNKDRFVEEKHFFLLEGEELKQFKSSLPVNFTGSRAPSLYLWTEKGAWLLAKSLNTDKAWQACEILVDDYYRQKDKIIALEEQVFILIGALNNAGEMNAKLLVDLQHTALSLTSMMDIEMFLFRLRQRLKLNGNDTSAFAQQLKQLESLVTRSQAIQETIMEETMKLSEYRTVVSDILTRYFQPIETKLLD